MGFSDPIKLAETNAELRPVFDPVLLTYSVQLWKGGQPAGIHGLIDDFRYPDQALGTVNDFLAESDVRKATEDELFQLYAGLVQAKGGRDWALFQMQIAEAEQA